MTVFDPVSNPKHYQSESGLEAIDVIEAFAKDNYCRGNAFKYLIRAGKKEDTRQDLEKALWYIQREIANLEQPLNESVPPFDTSKVYKDKVGYYWVHGIKGWWCGGEPYAAFLKSFGTDQPHSVDLPEKYSPYVEVEGTSKAKLQALHDLLGLGHAVPSHGDVRIRHKFTGIVYELLENGSWLIDTPEQRPASHEEDILPRLRRGLLEVVV